MSLSDVSSGRVPNAKGHTYPSKEIAMMRISEEANLMRCLVLIGRSDDRRLSSFGRIGLEFVVKVVLSDKFGWRVSECDTCSAQAISYVGANTAEAEVDPLAMETLEVGMIEMGTADSDEDNNNQVKDTPTKSHQTPFKSKWLILLFKNTISETPNLLNMQILMLISPYMESELLSDSLLQNAQCQERMEVFGNPDDNVMMINALVEEMKSHDHDVLVVEHNACEIYKMFVALILSEEINKCKTAGEKMKRADKISFIKN